MIVLTLNAHKGLSAVTRSPVLRELREALRAEAADVVLLQEVLGSPDGDDADSQSGLLAAGVWPYVAYGYTATNATGPFGNGVLSRFPIVERENVPLSGDRGEPRGALHCVLDVPGTTGVHVVSVHLGLTPRLRREQAGRLAARIRAAVPPEAPLVVAGDFNDWPRALDRAFRSRTRTHEAFAVLHGRVARTVPAVLPLLPLDRVYLRHLEPARASVRRGRPWSRLSDHAPLVVEVTPLSQGPVPSAGVRNTAQ